MFRTLTFTFALLACTASPTRAQEILPPTPGPEIVRDLASDDVHVFTTELPGGTYVSGGLTQMTVDAVVRVIGPDGEPLGTFDRTAVGMDLFTFEATEPGTYQIEVSPFREAAGRYSVALYSVGPVATTPEERVRQLLSPYDRPGTPGAVVGVVRGGRLAFTEAVGMSELAHDVSISTETVFDIGSIAKQITAFAVLLLAERGDLDLDADVRTILPEVPDFGTPLTLRHLLHHTGGVREVYRAAYMAGQRSGDLVEQADALAMVRRQPALEFEPGSQFAYSNTGYMLLAEVISRTTGEPFSVWMEANVFAPLGMDHTEIMTTPGQVIRGAAQSYQSTAEGYAQMFDNSSLQGAGGIYSTVGDIALWAQNLLTADVGGDLVRQRLVERGVLTSGDTLTYGAGIIRGAVEGWDAWSHDGASAGYRSHLVVLPEIDAAVITLSNFSSFTTLAPSVALAFFGEGSMPEEPQATSQSGDASPPPPLSHDLTDYVGAYISPELGVVYDLAVREGSLVLDRPRREPTPLRVVGDDLFVVRDLGPLTFLRDDAGGLVGFEAPTRAGSVTFEKCDDVP